MIQPGVTGTGYCLLRCSELAGECVRERVCEIHLVAFASLTQNVRGGVSTVPVHVWMTRISWWRANWL